MTHKRFLLFEYKAYYPSGGMADLTNSFDTYEEAIEHVSKNKGKHEDDYIENDFWHIYDRESGEIVERGFYNEEYDD